MVNYKNTLAVKQTRQSTPFFKKKKTTVFHTGIHMCRCRDLYMNNANVVVKMSCVMSCLFFLFFYF